MKKFLYLLALVSILSGCGGDAVQPLTPTVPPIPESFVDPTASLESVTFGEDVFIGPFARLEGLVSIGHDSNVQDNVLVTGPVAIGDHAILAHGCRVTGSSRIGALGGQPCFIGFNALVENAIVEPDAMVQSMARLGPGVTLHSGFKIKVGKNVTTQEEADRLELGKVEPVTNADRAFMAGVLEVNEDLAAGYARLQAADPSSVRGISADPPTTIDLAEGTPRLAGTETLDPTFRNRIVGDIDWVDTLAQLDLAMASRDSIRADEGGPFLLGHLAQMGSEVTYHALEHSELSIGDNFRVGDHAVIHGGEDLRNVPKEVTRIGNDVTVGPGAVVFRSNIGDGCVIGERACLDGSQLEPGTAVPPGTILIGNQNLGTVEW